jgi:3-hydroxyacyl-[acyl-carrier-protein] dehydratase
VDPEELQAFIREAKRRRIWSPPVDGSTAVDHGRPQIERLLQHRDPFLFVDRITQVDLQAQVVQTQRTIRPDDPLFAGHFPGEPIYPGVLQIETMGQAGLCLIHFVATGSCAVAPDASARPVRALKIHHAAFLAAVLPGDELTVIAKLAAFDDYTAVCTGQLLKGDTICAFAAMEVYLVD